MTFHPTLDEMRNFSEYIKYMESQGAHEIGIAKVKRLYCHLLSFQFIVVGYLLTIFNNQSYSYMHYFFPSFVKVVPPPEYYARKSRDYSNVEHIVKTPISQLATGRNGT